MVSEADSAPNCAGKGMRISEKIEVGYEDDFFAGCEMVNELFAVIVGDFGQDNGGVASRIWLLGRRGGSGLGENAHIPPPPGCVW